MACRHPLAGRRAWARLLDKVYELHVMACPKCGSRMEVNAVIFDPAAVAGKWAGVQDHRGAEDHK
jgi:hypothetical protein